MKKKKQKNKKKKYVLHHRDPLFLGGLHAYNGVDLRARILFDEHVLIHQLLFVPNKAVRKFQMKHNWQLWTGQFDEKFYRDWFSLRKRYFSNFNQLSLSMQKLHMEYFRHIVGEIAKKEHFEVRICRKTGVVNNFWYYLEKYHWLIQKIGFRFLYK